MLPMSEKCKTWEEEMYWKYFHSMHFYQCLPKDFHHHLVLPSKFAENMSTALPSMVSLVGPSGATWDVGVIKTDTLALAGDGWKYFAKVHNLKENFLMLFKYERNSTFKVLIFDQMTTCEKESTYFVKKSSPNHDLKADRKRSVDDAASTELMEDNDDGGGSDECVVSKKQKGDSEHERGNNSENPWPCSSDPSSEDQGQHNGLDLVLSNEAVELTDWGGRKSRQGSKSCMSAKPSAQGEGGQSEATKSRPRSGFFFNDDNIDTLVCQINEEEQIPIENQEKDLYEQVVLKACNLFSDKAVKKDKPLGKYYSCKRRGKKGTQAKRAIPKAGKSPLSKSGRKSVSKEYTSQRRPVTREETQNALSRAKEALTEGSFITTMRPTAVYKRFYLTIPADWMHKNLPRQHKEVILRVGEKTWGTWFYYNGSRSTGGLAAGWKNFAVENNLEDSDVCLFKPATQKHALLLFLMSKYFALLKRYPSQLFHMTPTYHIIFKSCEFIKWKFERLCICRLHLGYNLCICSLD